MSKSLRLSLLALVAASALTFAACSDDSGSSSAGTTASGGAATTGASGGATSTLDPIVGNVDLGPARRVSVLHRRRREEVPRQGRRPGQHEGEPGRRRHDPRRVRVQRHLGRPRERRVGEREARAGCSVCEPAGRHRRPRAEPLRRRSTLQTIDGLGDARAGCGLPRQQHQDRSSCSPATYELDVAAGPNQTLEQVEQLARDTLAKLPRELAARWAQ